MTVPGEPLTISPTEAGFAAVGEIDAHTAPKLSQALAGSDRAHIVIDMSGVEFVDSSGLRVLIEAHQQLQARDGSLQLARPSDAVVRLLEISGVDGYLQIAD